MTAGTVVITGGILATVILLCIIAVLCYCRLQVLPGEGGGDLVGVEPEGWLSRGTPQEDREAQGPGWSGGGYSQISGVGSGYLGAVQWPDAHLTKALAEAQRESRTWLAAHSYPSGEQQRRVHCLVYPSLPDL